MLHGSSNYFTRPIRSGKLQLYWVLLNEHRCSISEFMVNKDTWCRCVEMLFRRFLSSWMVLHYFFACSLHYVLLSSSFVVEVMDSSKLIFQTTLLVVAATFQEAALCDITFLHSNSPVLVMFYYSVLCFHRVYSLLYMLHYCYYITCSYLVSSVLCISNYYRENLYHLGLLHPM